MEDTLARALHCACARLDRIAAQLGAEMVAVSLHQDGRGDMAHFWSRAGNIEYRMSPAQLVHRSASAVIFFGFADSAPLQLPEDKAGDLDLIALAFWSAQEIAKLRAELKAANARLAGRKVVERAKGVLQNERGISEESAYAYLRGESRKRRITLTKIAEEVIRLNSSFNRRPIAGMTELTGVNS
jgi:AmiR/NasT family two-component response regulator